MPDPSSTDRAALAELTRHGLLRVGVNLSNTLLVTGRDADGAPTGVSPDIGRAIADRLGVGVRYVPYPSPGALADDAGADAWDIGNIGAEAQRAESIAFTAPYCLIEATYLVPAGSPIRAIEEVDRPGVRIAAMGRSAYGLRLERMIAAATLVRTASGDESYTRFVAEGLEALAGLRPRLLADAATLPGARVLEGCFATVDQAVGTPRANGAAAAWLAGVVEELKASGFVAAAIARHGVLGLSVAPPAA